MGEPDTPNYQVLEQYCKCSSTPNILSPDSIVCNMRKHRRNHVSHLSKYDHFPPAKNAAAY